MKKVFVEIPETHMTFHLFDNEIDAKMSKKLRALGLPNVQINYPSSPASEFKREDNGLYRQGDFACDHFTIISATESGTFSTIFNSHLNTIEVMLKGRFFCGLQYDEDALNETYRTVGFIQGIRLNDLKGKKITKPKDEWGTASPIEAVVEKNSYDFAAFRVDFTVSLEDDID